MLFWNIFDKSLNMVAQEALQLRVAYLCADLLNK
jgi:hypothetical protein